MSKLIKHIGNYDNSEYAILSYKNIEIRISEIVISDLNIDLEIGNPARFYNLFLLNDFFKLIGGLMKVSRSQSSDEKEHSINNFKMQKKKIETHAAFDGWESNEQKKYYISIKKENIPDIKLIKKYKNAGNGMIIVETVNLLLVNMLVDRCGGKRTQAEDKGV